MWRTCSGVLNAQAGVHAAHAVALGGELGVVPGREALELGPADPAGGEGALVASGLELAGGQGHFGPGGRRLLGVHAGGLEGVLVVVEHRGRAVERHAQHLAVGRGVVAGHGRHIGLGVELFARIGHHFAHRHDRALAGHHGGGADLEDLQDVGGIARAEGGDGGRHGLVVAALEGRHDLVFGLAGVEVLGQVVDPFAQGAAHGMPPLHFGGGVGGGADQGGQRHGAGQCGGFDRVFHGVSIGVKRLNLRGVRLGQLRENSLHLCDRVVTTGVSMRMRGCMLRCGTIDHSAFFADSEHRQ